MDMPKSGYFNIVADSNVDAITKVAGKLSDHEKEQVIGIKITYVGDNKTI